MASEEKPCDETTLHALPPCIRLQTPLVVLPGLIDESFPKRVVPVDQTIRLMMMGRTTPSCVPAPPPLGVTEPPPRAAGLPDEWLQLLKALGGGTACVLLHAHHKALVVAPMAFFVFSAMAPEPGGASNDLAMETTLGLLLNLWLPIECGWESALLAAVWVALGVASLWGVFEELRPARIALPFIACVGRLLIPTSETSSSSTNGYAPMLPLVAYLAISLADSQMCARPMECAWVKYGSILVCAPCAAALGVIGLVLMLAMTLRRHRDYVLRLFSGDSDTTPLNEATSADGLDVHEAFRLARAQYLSHQNEKNA